MANFPFTAIVGQEDLKTAVLLAVIDPGDEVVYAWRSFEAYPIAVTAAAAAAPSNALMLGLNAADNAELELPDILVDQEVEVMHDEFRGSLARQGITEEAYLGVVGKGEADLHAEFRPQAEKRVRMGLVVTELVRAHNLSATAEQIKSHIEDLASSYEKPEDVVRWYYSDMNRLGEVEAMVIENNVTQHVLASAKVKDKSISFDELMGQA